jgi:hypothetical protein
MLISAPTNDAPKLMRYEARTRGLDTVAQNCAQLTVALLNTTAESGRSTISDRYSTVKPIASPNPGRTECRRRSRITTDASR